jgi:hypothetical protein
MKEAANGILADPRVKKGLWGVGVATTEATYIGLSSEDKAIKNLKTIRSTKLRFVKIGVITEITSYQHLSPEDRKGIDIKVVFSSGKPGDPLFIDVKNSGGQELMERMSDRNRCLLVIPWDASDEDAMKIIIGTIKWFCGLFDEEKRR